MVAVNPHIRSVVDHDGAVLLDLPRNAITILNATGSYIWERLQNGMSLEGIIQALAHDMGADESVIARDVDEFMEQLKGRRLIDHMGDNGLTRERG